MGFFRQEYWSELPFPSEGDLSDRGLKPESPALQADSLSSEAPGKPYMCVWLIFMTTHSSILAWGIPRTEEPGRLQSIRLQKVGHD